MSILSYWNGETGEEEGMEAKEKTPKCLVLEKTWKSRRLVIFARV